MKAKHIILTAIASLLAVVGCQKPETFDTEEIKLSTETLSFSASREAKTVTLNATVDWAVKDYAKVEGGCPSWIGITPVEGKASKDAVTIEIVVEANTEGARSYDIVFCNPTKAKTLNTTLTITQESGIKSGTGTKEDPFTVADVIKKNNDTGLIDGEIFVKGVVAEIDKLPSNYNTADIYIADALEGEKLYVYHLNNFGATGQGDGGFTNESLKKGDKVVIRGKMAIYNDKLQLKSAFLVALNGEEGQGGEGGGGEETDYSKAPAKTVAEFIAAADKDTYYKLTGMVSNKTVNEKGFLSFDLTDETGTIYVYSFLDKEAAIATVSDGGTVVLAGKYDYYANKSQHEVVNAVILSFEAGEGGGGEDTPPTSDQPTLTKVTIAEFLNKTVNTTDWYELTGKIVNIASTQYGNLTIEDETGSVYIYGVTSEWIGVKNDESFSQLNLKVNDILTIGSLRSEHQGTAQGGGNTIAAFYISHEEGKVDEIPAGSITLSFPDDNSASNGLTKNQYASSWTAKSGEFTFEIYGFNNNNWNNNWTLIKCGSKNSDSNAYISTKTAMPKLASVIVTFNSVDVSLVKSATLSIYSDEAMSSQVGEAIDVKASLKTGDVKIAIPAANQAANQYYKLSFETLKGQKNGFVEIAKFVYLAAE